MDPLYEFSFPENEVLIPRIAEHGKKSRMAKRFPLDDTQNGRTLRHRRYTTVWPQAHLSGRSQAILACPLKPLWTSIDLKDKEDERKIIDVVGVETSLCVLANTLKLQRKFLESDILIQSSLTVGKKQTEEIMEILKVFNLEVR